MMRRIVEPTRQTCRAGLRTTRSAGDAASCAAPCRFGAALVRFTSIFWVSDTTRTLYRQEVLA